jgi:hypothetical protein
MGSWDETCFFSNATITPGDRVYLFILVHVGNDARMCYAHDNWSPVVPPILCKYDDCGRYEALDPEWYVETALSAIRPVLAEKEKENEYVDNSVSKDKFDWGMLMDGVHESVLEIWYTNTKGEKTKQQVSFVAIREDVINELLGIDYRYFIMRWNREWVSPKVTDESRLLDEDIDKLVQAIQTAKVEGISAKYKHRWVDTQKEVYEKLTGLKKEKNYHWYEDPTSPRLWWAILAADNILNYMRGMDCPHFWANKEYEMKDFYIEAVKEDTGKLRLSITRIFQYIKIIYIFSTARKTWGPTCGAGSQHNNWGLTKCLSKIVYNTMRSNLKNLKEQHKEWEECK